MRTQEQIRTQIESEREQLVGAVEQLRESIGEATNAAARVKAKLPFVAAAAATTGLVIAGGIRATTGYFARRRREDNERVRVGPWSVRRRS